MQNQSDYTGAVENTNYFPMKGLELTDNRALTMEGDEKLKNKKTQQHPVLWNDINFIIHLLKAEESNCLLHKLLKTLAKDICIKSTYSSLWIDPVLI